MKKNYTYVYENSFNDDFSKLDKLINKNDISIAFSNSIDVERKQGLIDFADSLEDKKTLLLEASLGKGGAGQGIGLSLINLATYSIFITFSYSFLSELSKDIYKISLGKLFEQNQVNKYNIGNVVVEISLDDIRLQYVFFDYFTKNDSIEAFDKITEHIISLDKKTINGRLGRFVYDRKKMKWMIM